MKTLAEQWAEALLVGPLLVWGGRRLTLDHPGQPWGPLITLWGVKTTASAGLALVRHHRGGLLPGGLGDRLRPSEVDPRELAAGMRVEREHTTDPELAREIALDHLAEDPRYYTRLATIEQHPHR